MRVFGHSVLVGCLAAGVLMGAQTQPGTDAAEKVLAEARKAIGGEAKLSAIKSFVATGRTRRVSGDNLVPVEFEIDVELPDKYVRKDEVPAQESAPSSSGFNGDNLIQIPPPAPPPAAPPSGSRAAGTPAGAASATPPAGARGTGAPAGAAPAGAAPATPPAAAPPGTAPAPPATPPPPAPAGAPPAAGGAMPPAGPARPGGPAVAMPPGGGPAGPGGRAAGPPMTPQQQQEAARKARVTTVKQDFARLTLGMFAASFGSYPLTFNYVGQAEAPQGKADVLEVKGAGNFAVRLFVGAETHLPVMVSWTVPVTPANIVLLAPGQAKPTSLQPGAIVVQAPAAPPAGASKEDQDKYAKDVAALRQKTVADAKPIEYRLYYADYRDNDGLQFPFRLRRAVGPDTVEETIFDRFKLNAKIDPKRFEPVK